MNRASFEAIVSVHLAPDSSIKVALHKGRDYEFRRPRRGVVDTLTRTHGCFADYIQALPDDDDVFAEIDGKGVFLHATRGARAHIFELLGRNGLAFTDVQLLIEHQANFCHDTHDAGKTLQRDPLGKKTGGSRIYRRQHGDEHSRKGKLLRGCACCGCHMISRGGC